MNYRKVLFIILVLLLLPFSLKLKGADFGQNGSLFTDIKAHDVGDILTVMIYENARGTQKAESKTDKSTKISTAGGPGMGSLDFIPIFGGKAENSNTFDGKGENSRNQSLRAKMSVTVVQLKKNGDLVIKGSRTIGISGDRETITLNGVVRQKDVSPKNTIDSYLIADAEIHYTGKGNANTASRPGFFTRLLSWVF